MGEQAAAPRPDRSDGSASDLLRAFRPVEPTRLADRVVEQVQELILTQGLEPGERLPSERDLAAHLGTSRAIVSQALRTLSVMGLVEVRPGSGAYVTRNPQAMFVASMDLLVRTDEESATALAELRFWLESAGAVRAIEVAGRDRTDEIERAFARLEASTGSTSEWIAADTIFHSAVVRAAGNPLLGPLFEAVHGSMVSVLYDEWVESEIPPSWLQGDNRGRQLDLHRPIFEAIRDRDPDRLQAALRAHHDFVLAHIEEHRRRTPEARPGP